MKHFYKIYLDGYNIFATSVSKIHKIILSLPHFHKIYLDGYIIFATSVSKIHKFILSLPHFQKKYLDGYIIFVTSVSKIHKFILSLPHFHKMYTECTMHNSVSLLTLFWRRYLDQLCLATEPSISDKNDHILLQAIFFFFPPWYLPHPHILILPILFRPTSL